MARTPRPRPSIAEQLADIAATSSRDNVKTSEREGAPQLEAEPDAHTAVTPDAVGSRENVTTSSRDTLSTRRRGAETADGLRVRQRVEKPHASLYAHPRVFKKLREIAAAEDCKPHDLYVEGLRMILARYGFDLDKLERGET